MNRYDLEPLRMYLRKRWMPRLHRSCDFTGRHVETWKTLAQMGFGIVALIGISMWSLPAALLLAGVAGIIAIERQ